MYLYVPCIYTHVPCIYIPGESYRRRLGSLLLYLCYVFRALINSLVYWFCRLLFLFAAPSTLWQCQLLLMWLITVLVVSKSVGFLGLISLFKATDIAKKNRNQGLLGSAICPSWTVVVSLFLKQLHSLKSFGQRGQVGGVLGARSDKCLLNQVWHWRSLISWVLGVLFVTITIIINVLLIRMFFFVCFLYFFNLYSLFVCYCVALWWKLTLLSVTVIRSYWQTMFIFKVQYRISLVQCVRWHVRSWIQRTACTLCDVILLAAVSVSAEEIDDAQTTSICMHVYANVQMFVLVCVCVCVYVRVCTHAYSLVCSVYAIIPLHFSDRKFMLHYLFLGCLPSVCPTMVELWGLGMLEPLVWHGKHDCLTDGVTVNETAKGNHAISM